MLRRVCGLLVASLLSACAWPHVRPDKHGPDVSTHLDAIQRLVEDYATPPAMKRKLLDALYVCRKNCHLAAAEGQLGEKKHSDYVAASLLWALEKKWDKTLGNLEHGAAVEAPMPPPPPDSKLAWPDTQCGLMTARAMLMFIDARVDGPHGPRLPNGEPDTDLIKEIHDLVAACRANHPGRDPIPDAEHCAAVADAYWDAAAVNPDWSWIATELDHMP